MPKILKKYLPILFGIGILLIIVIAAPRQKILRLLSSLKVETLMILALLGCLYYLSKAVRFWLMLRQLNIKVPLIKVVPTYLAAQPVSLLPAGELYRAVLLEQYLKIKVSRSYPTVVMQGVIEGIVLLAFAVVGALTLGRARLPVLVFAVFFILTLVAVQQNWIERLRPLLNRLPFVNIQQHKIHEFVEQHKVFLQKRNLLVLVVLSCIPILAGITILWVSAHAMGVGLSWGAASLGYTLPVVLAGLSFLPGGLGASEGSTIGLLKIMSVSTTAAFAITLLVRLFTLGVGLAAGALALVIMHSKGGRA